MAIVLRWAPAERHYPLARVANLTSDPELEALRAGDEAAFASLLDRYHGPLFRLAMGYLRDRDAAEDAVQETWLQVLAGLDRFEGRSSLKTWIFGILLNVARSRRRRESRLLPFTSLFRRGEEGGGPIVDADRFNSDGRWTSLPDNWAGLLGISEANQRVRLHRARGHVRRVLEEYLR